MSLKKTVWIAVGLVLLAVTGVILVSVMLVLSFTRGCWPQDRVERLSEYLLGHPGPVWGRVEGGDAIVFGWDEGLLYPLRNQYGGSLYSVSPDGTALTLLSPSVGDGRELGCYGAPRDDGQSYDYRVAFDTSPAISPDGATVAYTTERQSVYPAGLDIVTVALDSGELRRVTPGREAGEDGAERGKQYEPAWSPDGTRIAFLEDGVLHMMAVDGSDGRSIVPGITSAPEPPAWSPDGTRLAFRGWRSGEGLGRNPSENWALYVVRADGSDLTRATEGITSAALLISAPRNLPPGKPVWSPDGRRIAFERRVLVSKSPHSAVDGIHVLDVEAGTVELLVGSDEPILQYVEGPIVWDARRCRSSVLLS